MNERIKRLLTKQNGVLAGSGLVVFAAGFGLGYLVGKKRAPMVVKRIFPADVLDKFEDDGEAEQDPIVYQTGLDLQDITEDIVLNPRRDPNEIVIEYEPDVSNIFDNEDEWNHEAELSTRIEGQPYIIHIEEFENEEAGFSQSTLTYYEGDDILVDERETPVYNHSQVVGELRFGHGSNDQNVVYVRNEKLHADYEVLRDSGYYSVEVLGQQMEDDLVDSEIRHSSHVIRRFKEE